MKSIPCDINEHLETLKRYTEKCDSVVEMGVRTIVSTWAFLAGKPKKLTSIDLYNPRFFGGNLDEVYDSVKDTGIDFTFIEGNSLECTIDKCDLLFIDTLHNYFQLKHELERHCSNVNKYIIMHDTVSFGYGDESPHGSPITGLMPAINEFLENHPDWILLENYQHNNGLGVLKRINNKKVVVISTYPNTDKNEQILNECIDRFSSTDYDIIVVAHYPIPVYIQEKVSYVIYDKENTMMSYEDTPTWYCNADTFFTRVFSNGHIFTVAKNMINGIGLANQLGYDFFLYIEADNIFSDNDFDRINNLRQLMFDDNKKMIFFNPMIEGDLASYESLIFAGVPSFFVENSNLSTDSNHSAYKGISLERLFFANFSKYSDQFIVIQNATNNYFNTSSINKISNHYIVEVIGNNQDDRLILWIQNDHFSKYPLTISINSEPSFIVTPGSFFYNYVNTELPLSILVNDGETTFTKNFPLTEEAILKYRKKGIINYKV